MPELKTKAVLTPKTDERGRELNDTQKKRAGWMYFSTPNPWI